MNRVTGVLALVMAGGKGTRLDPLTRERAKPAVPFGGKYKLIDFVLSNLVNSGIYSVYVLTQFKSQALAEHIREAWSFGSLARNHFITTVPAQMRTGETWYLGTADSVYQNLCLVEEHSPEIVIVFAGDHVYRMDVRQMIQAHVEREADVTVAVVPMPVEKCRGFGVVVVDDYFRIVGFEEKPAKPTPMPQDPAMALVSMGNYLFNRRVLLEETCADAENSESEHDFGHDILPKIIKTRAVFAYDFRQNRVPGMTPGEDNSYWRDVGTIDAYWEANMDLRAAAPVFNLYNLQWPVRTADFWNPPAKFVHEAGDRIGRAINSLVTDGCIISGATVRGSILGRQVFVHSYAEVTDCVLLDGVDVGGGAKLLRAVVDENVHIPPGAVIGYNLEEDRKHFCVSDGGVIVITRTDFAPTPVGTVALAPVG
jgi:glucose-1-phosphate adenylyltransferase